MIVENEIMNNYMSSNNLSEGDNNSKNDYIPDEVSDKDAKDNKPIINLIIIKLFFKLKKYFYSKIFII